MASVNSKLAKADPTIRDELRRSAYEMPKQMTHSPNKAKKTKNNFSPRKTY